MKHQLGETLDVLTTRTVDHDGITVIELAGEIDMMTAQQPLAEIRGLLEHPPAGLAVDLRAVSFFGSSGINLLLIAQEQAQLQDVPLAVVADQSFVLRTLTLTGVDMQFALFPSLAAALSALHAFPVQTQR